MIIKTDCNAHEQLSKGKLEQDGMTEMGEDMRDQVFQIIYESVSLCKRISIPPVCHFLSFNHTTSSFNLVPKSRLRYKHRWLYRPKLAASAFQLFCPLILFSVISS